MLGGKEMRYKLVSATSSTAATATERVEQEVNKLLEQGWKPLGSVSVSMSAFTHTSLIAVVQSMIKE